jgi:hypothetical protein
MIFARRQLMWLVALAAAATGFGAFADDEDGANFANTFISPCGKPFRAPRKAPYPVAKWFAEADKNQDGKLDRTEFMDDAEAFFKVLDQGGKGLIDNFDVQVYEHNIAPEVLGYRIEVQAGLRRSAPGARLWLAQDQGSGDESGDDDQSKPKTLDESGQGAAPYSFFQEPEPVTAADFDFNGRITRANFLKLADMHFSALDTRGAGFLTLADLPKTLVQKKLEHGGRRS